MIWTPLKNFIGRNACRLGNRWRALRLVRWLSQQEGVVWISVIRPTNKARDGGLPKLDTYRGLRAVTEVKNAAGEVEWHFLWGTECAADRHESIISHHLGASAATRTAVRCVEMPKEKWWKRTLPWGLFTGALASVAALTANLDAINNFLLQLRHRPEMTIESRETLQVASDSNERKDISLRGDPYFRARLTDLSMQIAPDPKYHDAVVLSNGGKVVVPASHRSVDVSGDLKLQLPFDNVPAGHYVIMLRGKVNTAWSSAEFAPRESLRLDARAPISGKKKQVTPWPPEAATEKKFPEALVDIQFVFGRPKDETSDLRVVLKGEWVGWAIEDLAPGAVLQSLSQNTPKNPKSVVFGLSNVKSKPFTSQTVRVRIKGVKPLTTEEWEKIVSEPEVDIL